jgi:peptidoglycan/xylan/chitin deacetylase (PgdA/CDA1 family)
MSAEQLRALRQLGIDVESHGHAHIDMSIARPDDLRADLALSIEEIERITGARPRFLSYPFGASSATAESIAAEMGFEAAFSVNRRDGGRYAAARVPAVRSDSAALFRLKTSGVYPAIRFSTAGTVAVRVYRRLDRSAA